MEKEKEGNKIIKENGYAKMEACVRIVMMIVITIGIVNYSSSIGNWAWFTACIGIFFILQTLTKKQTRT
ncbi:hypothetical protein [Bacillus pseudomycoides]|uniref:hypothetical protein n=1 Tax=Bacillus pseudomycoides TaxID=64104 RepID=UPI0020D24855|nr:hypothetical protein [Bacillus pseudomycoides]